MTAAIIDLIQEFAAKQWINKRIYEATELHQKHLEMYEQNGLPFHLYSAGVYAGILMMDGEDLV